MARDLFADQKGRHLVQVETAVRFWHLGHQEASFDATSSVISSSVNLICSYGVHTSLLKIPCLKQGG